MEKLFVFKQFRLMHHLSTMKVGTDAVLLGAWANAENTDAILDAGTGCGILALMMAQRFHGQIIALDIDSASVSQALENFRLSPWSNRLKAINQSFQQFAPENSGSIQRIISNPPFFENSLKAPESRRSNARHNDTLPFKEFIISAKHVLTENGSIQLILPYLSIKSFQSIAEFYDFQLLRQTTVFPKPNTNPERALLEFSFKHQKSETSDLIIRNEDNNYTDEYKALTRDFYLAF